MMLLDELQKKQTENELAPYYKIPSNWLRQENSYEITALITDGNFEVYHDLTFIPTKCHWFEIEGADSYSSYSKLDQMPGD